MWLPLSSFDIESPLTPRRARSRSTRSRRARRTHLGVEVLEGRSVPATVPVNTFADVVDPGDGLTSLREAIAVAADPATRAGADTVVLPHEIGGVAGTYALSLGELAINDATGKLTIMSDGGPATVDAQQASRVFEVFVGSEVVFQKLTITGGSADHGGGIINLGTATITNSTLSGNSAKNGGGFYNHGIATIIASTFSGNSTSGFGGGGGIWNDLGTLTISASTFSGNATGTGFGGGILNSATATISASTFSGNSADAGGGILNFGTVTISGSTFSGNSASTFGGGVDNHGPATITDSILDGNSADYGGGIGNQGTAAISDSTFGGNSADFDGGGIWNGPAGTLDVSASTLGGNSADTGGGLYNHGIATIADSILSDNSALYGGGLLNFATGTLEVNDSTLSGNSVVNNGGGIWNIGKATLTATALSGNEAVLHDGGGIWNGGTATVADSIISGNSAAYGGGILNVGTAKLNVTASTFSGNEAVLHDGGGIWNGEFATLTVTASALSDNSAGFGGGLYNHGIATVADTTLSGNSALYGGGILNFVTGTLEVNDSTLSGNSVVNNGGGIWNIGRLTVAGSALDGNSAEDTGGGVFNAETATLTINASTFTGNSSSFGVGGAIWSAGTTTVSGSTFSGNWAAHGSAGGIYIWGGMLTFAASALTDNWADGTGGLFNAGTATITDSTIGHNTSNHSGGGMFNLGTATITNSTLSGNSAGQSAGGLYNLGTATITGSILSDNSAVDDGGGIFNTVTATLAVTSSTISGNFARTAGGILNFGTATLTITSSTISGNKAVVRDGGGIYNASPAPITIKASTISGNSARSHGGGIFNSGAGKFTVSASNLIGNSADFGGGIYNVGEAPLIVTSSSVRGNSAGFDGGGIFTFSTATITNSTISDNTGVGVFIEGGSGSQLLGNTITGNSKSGVIVWGTNHLIGSPVAGNIIANNGEAGVGVVVGATTGIAIRGNAIYGNAGLGIDLGLGGGGLEPDGPTPNDPGDADVGPNHLQNVPVLVLAKSDAAGTIISGTLNSTANTRFLIDFYASPPAGSPPGMTYMGSALVLTDAGGNMDFGVTLPTAVAAGWGITATATTTDVAPFGDTSEFAVGIPVFAATPPNQAPVISNQTFSVNENKAGGTLVGTVAASDPNAGQTLSYQITAGNALGAFAIDGSTGRITVANGALLDFETTPVFTLTVRVSDNGSPALSSTATVTVNLSNVNEAPVNSVPSFPQSVARNDTLTFSGARGNAISLSDPDAGTAKIQVSLTVLHGRLTLARTTGLDFLDGDGTSDRTMTFRGTVAGINAALSGLEYTPDKGYAGSDSLAISTSDPGSGLGDPLMDSDSVSILVEDQKKPKLPEDKKPKLPEDKKPK